MAARQDKVGRILEGQGRFEEALSEYQSYRSIMLHLTQQDPGNLDWQRELSVSYNAGGVLAQEGRQDEALREYQVQKEIMIDMQGYGELKGGNMIFSRPTPAWGRRFCPKVGHKNP